MPARNLISSSVSDTYTMYTRLQQQEILLMPTKHLISPDATGL